jgi:hypothetical protein
VANQLQAGSHRPPYRLQFVTGVMEPLTGQVTP